MYKGIAGSEGIGIGNVVIIEEHEIVIENKKITDTDAEIARLQGAIEKFVNDTNAMADRMEKTVGAKDADILRGHIQMLQDPTIEEQITALIVSEKITAEKALDQVLEQTAEIFAQIPDELLQQRATDFRDRSREYRRNTHRGGRQNIPLSNTCKSNGNPGSSQY